ncbi:MAG: DUF2806 domain-containing protein [Elusimicrobiales bacterium]|nr:DUF2806 domain-containing protein [Elusimicrobiales bacterium]
MDRIPFCFPVFYLGMIEKRTIKNQKDAVNILFNGSSEAAPAWEIQSEAANKYIQGGEGIPAGRVEQIFELSDAELVRRVRLLNIEDARTCVSAFHVFLCKRADISEEKIRKLESIARETADPACYIAAAFRESLYYAGAAKKYLPKEVKAELKTLHKVQDVPDLFSLWEMSSNLPAAPDTAMPMVIKGVMSILLADGDFAPEVMGAVRTGEFSAAVQMLFKNGKLTLYDCYKWGNALQIAEQADAELRRESGVSISQEFDFDWLIRFFEAAGNIRNEDMQRLWARVLAGEMKKSGSFSLRTVETLRNLTAREALIFQNAMSLVLEETDGTRFLFCDTDLADASVNEKYGLGMGDILMLEENGLISALRVDNEIEVDADGCTGFFNGADQMILFQAESPQTFHYRSYPLSQAARQLLPVIQAEADEDYLADLGAALKNHLLDRIAVSAHRVISRQGDEIELDLESDLLEQEEV